MKYQVIDTHTGWIMGTYTERKKASRRADKLDMIYGAVRYAIRNIKGE